MRRGSRPGTWARRRKRTPVHWVRDVFEANTIDQTGGQTVEALSLLEYDDYEPGTTTVQHDITVRRAIVDVALSVVPLVTGTTPIALSIMIRHALTVLDAEETDGDLTTAAQGSLLQSSRVLHTGVTSCTVIAPSTSAGTIRTNGTPGPKIEIDWRGGAKLRPDDALFMLMQLVFPVTDISAACIIDYACSSSILVNLKG